MLWSDYHEEHEYFFIGGLQTFHLQTIHDIVTQRDYKPFIEVIMIFDAMISGHSFHHRAVTRSDAAILDRLIRHHLSDSPRSGSSGVPLYIESLFANFCSDVRVVEMNIYEMNRAITSNGFGYLVMKRMFFMDCGTSSECIKLSLFFRLFDHSLESILIFNARGSSYNPSIRLNSALSIALLAGCKVISSNPRLRARFQSVTILKPKDSVHHFVDEQHDYFADIEWNIDCLNYHPPRSPSLSGISPPSPRVSGLFSAPLLSAPLLSEPVLSEPRFSALSMMSIPSMRESQEMSDDDLDMNPYHFLPLQTPKMMKVKSMPLVTPKMQRVMTV